MAAFERVAAWAKGRAAAAAAELATRPAMNPAPPMPRAAQASTGSRPRAAAPGPAGTELSLRPGISPYAATRLLALGAALTGVLQATGDALDTGTIDWARPP